jgi:5-methyltetrahydropteroyltriglutamate--homocysteine methyltransferase
LKKALERILPTSPCRFTLAVYFSPLAPLWDALQAMPVHELQLDFTRDREELLKKIHDNPGKKDVGLGLLDARSTRMENVEETAQIVRRWMDKTGGSRCTLAPSCGLEFLPRTFAFEKLKRLFEIRRAVEAIQPVTSSHAA